MKHASLKNTLEVMDSYFLDTSKNAINTAYLFDFIDVTINNTYALYTAVHESRRPIRSIVWGSLLKIANDNLKYNDYETVATSEHLKKWLASHNAGYEVLEESITYFEKERKE